MFGSVTFSKLVLVGATGLLAGLSTVGASAQSYDHRYHAQTNGDHGYRSGRPSHDDRGRHDQHGRRDQHRRYEQHGHRDYRHDGPRPGIRPNGPGPGRPGGPGPGGPGRPR